MFPESTEVQAASLLENNPSESYTVTESRVQSQTPAQLGDEGRAGLSQYCRRALGG